MAVTQDSRQLKIATGLGEDFLLLQRLSAREELSGLFRYDVELWHEEAEAGDEPTYIDPKKILGKAVSISLRQTDGTERFFNGIVSEFEQGGRTNRFSVYQAAVVPQVWILTQNVQSRIFQNQSVPDILKKIFAGFEIGWELQGDYQPRNYSVQYRETDFDFASRLMEEEGIYYYFTHSEDNHKMIVADTPQSHRDCPKKKTIEYCLERAATDGFVSAIRTWNQRSNLRTGRVTLWDHNFQLPGKKLEADQPSLFPVAATNKELEVYEYPAGYARKQDGIAQNGGESAKNLQKIFDDNKRTAKVRMEEIDSQTLVASGMGDCCSMTAGF
jgi:type VI secretion system secreted protein VgrG